MKRKSRFNSFYAVVFLGVLVLVVYFVARSFLISADQSDSFYYANPLKVGDNQFITTKAIDLSQRIIGINGSLITVDEAKRRGVIEGIFSEDGGEFSSNSLLVDNSSFIIKVRDISVSPALFLEGIR